MANADVKYIKVATWNVNSIRARMESVMDFIKAENPDIILMQEIKCKNPEFPSMEFLGMGYNSEIVGQKSYNGVAVLSKFPLTVELRSLPDTDDYWTNHEARYLECIVEAYDRIIRAASVYVPNGDSALQKGQKLEDSERFVYKLKWMDKLEEHIAKVLKYENEICVFGGDYNVANEPIDLHNPKGANGGVGFHIEERMRFKNILTKCTDAWRTLNKDEVGYSWWDYRHNGYTKNRGWRLDYLLGCQNFMQSLENCIIYKPTREHPRPSDHVPVIGTLKIT